jgi:hypothetical protein
MAGFWNPTGTTGNRRGPRPLRPGACTRGVEFVGSREGRLDITWWGACPAGPPGRGKRQGASDDGSRRRTAGVGLDLRFQAACSYSLISPPSTVHLHPATTDNTLERPGPVVTRPPKIRPGHAQARARSVSVVRDAIASCRSVQVRCSHLSRGQFRCSGRAQMRKLPRRSASRRRAW